MVSKSKTFVKKVLDFFNFLTCAFLGERKDAHVTFGQCIFGQVQMGMCTFGQGDNWAM